MTIYPRVLAAIQAPATLPRPVGVQELDGIFYRIRVGRYRVIYAVNDAEQKVIITKVAKRTERTYKNL